MGSSALTYNGSFFAVSFPAAYVALVEIDRADKLNAFKDPMWENLASTFRKLDTDPDVRAVVLTGRGEKGFSAGLDVTAASTSGPLSPAPVSATNDIARRALRLRQHILYLQSTLSTISSCSKPVIAALHGIAYGLAIDIASACDIRLCASNTRLSVAETGIGLAADVGTLSRLPKLGCSLSWVKDVCYTSRVWDAIEAERAGFVGPGGVCEGGRAQVVSKAVAMATRIGTLSPVAVVGTKRVLDFSCENRTGEGLEYVAVWNASMLQTGDVRDAMTSGLAKREMPRFAKL